MKDIPLTGTERLFTLWEALRDRGNYILGE
jgi:hypothetical protein